MGRRQARCRSPVRDQVCVQSSHLTGFGAAKTETAHIPQARPYPLLTRGVSDLSSSRRHWLWKKHPNTTSKCKIQTNLIHN